MQEGESRLHAGADLSERFSEPFSVLDVCKISDLSGTRIRGTSRKSVPLTVPVSGLSPLTDLAGTDSAARLLLLRYNPDGVRGSMRRLTSWGHRCAFEVIQSQRRVSME